MSAQSKLAASILLLALVVWNPERTAAIEQAVSFCVSANDDRVRPIPPELTDAAIRLFGLHTDNVEWVRESTVYRCMAGAVWLCNHGANLTCDKANTRRNLPSITTYCMENPNEQFVPMAVTGHDTIYTWECVRGKPRSKPSQKVDARGFIAEQWRRLE